jgi:hypothetical protein
MTGSFILPAMAKSIGQTKKEEVEGCIEVTRLEPVFDGPRRRLSPPAHQFANYEEVLQQPRQQPHFSLRAYLLRSLKAAKRLFKIGLIVSIPVAIAGMLFLV